MTEKENCWSSCFNLQQQSGRTYCFSKKNINNTDCCHNDENGL